MKITKYFWFKCKSVKGSLANQAAPKSAVLVDAAVKCVELGPSSIPLETFADKLNQVIYDDSSVVPIFHRQFSWFVSDDIDYRFSPISVVPRFDLLRFKVP